MSKARSLLAALVVVLCASGCGTLSSSAPLDVAGDARWAVLPIENLSTTPRAGERAADLLETALRARGVRTLDVIAAPAPETLAELLDDEGAGAATWAAARAGGYRYAMTGTVHEWHYRRAPDDEPAIGLSLKLLDVASGAVLWQGSAARTGRGYANLSNVGMRVVRELLDGVRVRDGIVAAAAPAR